jgi:acetyl esterase
MPLDPQAKAVMDQVAALGFPAVHTVSPQQARANAQARPRAVGPEVARVENRTIPGPDSQVPVRIYTPPGSGPFPALVWFHGGGWVVGDLESADATARLLTLGAGCVVVSVDYRLAPEAKFPGPAEDCYAATRWVAEHAAEIGVSGNNLAVGGDSAGGNLAAAVCLMVKDRGGPPLGMQLLVYPVTDRNFETGSYGDNAEGYSLTRETMIWYWDKYLANDADGGNAYAAPLRAQDLGGLPSAVVITAEYDPLRDEGEAYANRLEAAGVPTTLTRYPGMIHGFFGMSAVVDKGKDAIAQASAALTAAFAD